MLNKVTIVARLKKEIAGNRVFVEYFQDKRMPNGTLTVNISVNNTTLSNLGLMQGDIASLMGLEKGSTRAERGSPPKISFEITNDALPELESFARTLGTSAREVGISKI